MIYHLDALVGDEKDGGSKTRRPIADPKYWLLLQDTLASSSSVSSPRPLKAWLLPLLFRVNLAGIVAEPPTLRDNCKDLAAIYACPCCPHCYLGPSLRKGWGWMRWGIFACIRGDAREYGTFHAMFRSHRNSWEVIPTSQILGTSAVGETSSLASRPSSQRRTSSVFQLYCARVRTGLQVRTTHIEMT